MFVILQVLIGNYEANCLEFKKEKKKKLTTVRIEPGPDKKKGKKNWRQWESNPVPQTEANALSTVQCVLNMLCDVEINII